MIKLNKPIKPVDLTPEVENSLISEFKANQTAVWSQEFIKKPLLAMSFDKCSFCETKVNEESKYMEIEHFHHKHLYPDEVVAWDNLLPSCKRCNGKKGTHDTKREPIVNPCLMNPKNHLSMWRYRFKGKDQIGKMTISVLDLNNQIRLVQKRFEIGNAIQIKLEDFNELSDDVLNGAQSGTRRKNRIVNGLKELMQLGLPRSEYSATYATILITDPEYIVLKKKLTSLKLWDAELDTLQNSLEELMLV